MASAALAGGGGGAGGASAAGAGAGAGSSGCVMSHSMAISTLLWPTCGHTHSTHVFTPSTCFA
jgi:hypothetical protein